MIPAISNNAAGPSASISPDGPALAASTDFETFLSLLTTQLQHQDPLNPLESHEFASQLATFSAVEQQAYTNKLLGQMIAASGAGELGQAAGWIGKEALTTAPVWYGGAALSLEMDSALVDRDAELITYNAAGIEVGRNVIRPDTRQFDWSPINSNGDLLTEGRYYFQIEIPQESGDPITSPVGVYSTIHGVKRGPGGTELLLDNQTPILVSDIYGLREGE